MIFSYILAFFCSLPTAFYPEFIEGYYLLFLTSAVQGSHLMVQEGQAQSLAFVFTPEKFILS